MSDPDKPILLAIIGWLFGLYVSTGAPTIGLIIIGATTLWYLSSGVKS